MLKRLLVGRSRRSARLGTTPEDQVDVALCRYRTEQDVTELWAIRERVDNALRHGAGSPVAIRASAQADQCGSPAVG